MRAISPEEARELIRTQKAGWYATYANPPIPHSESMVVTVGGKNYLTTKDEFHIEEIGLVEAKGIDGKPILKQAWVCVIEEDGDGGGKELAELLRDECKDKPLIDVGAGVQSYYTGKHDSEQQRN